MKRASFISMTVRCCCWLSRRYETIWLPMLAKASQDGTAHKLQPPIDIMFVQYVHRLSPAAYWRDWQAALAATRSSTAPTTNHLSSSLNSSLDSSAAKGPSAAGSSFASSASSNWDINTRCSSSIPARPSDSRSSFCFDDSRSSGSSVSAISSFSSKIKQQLTGHSSVVSTTKAVKKLQALQAWQPQALPPWKLSMGGKYLALHKQNVSNQC